jgi:hypothetical protein
MAQAAESKDYASAERGSYSRHRSRNLQIPFGPWHHHVYDRLPGAVVGIAASPLTPSRIEAMQCSKLDGGAKFGLVIGECLGTYHAPSTVEIHSHGRVQLMPALPQNAKT